MWHCRFYTKIRGTPSIPNGSTLLVANSTFSICVSMGDSVYEAGTEHIIFNKKTSSKSQITFRIKLVRCQNQMESSLWRVTANAHCQGGCGSSSWWKGCHVVANRNWWNTSSVPFRGWNGSSVFYLKCSPLASCVYTAPFLLFFL